ncbi:TMEM208 [Cordylochernes scorpioides]|uniref:Transmembrane protein 208 n=1 Tax=Cordylochernes scorpioides TaxID=51811 RepID=A0ABY6K4K3_9ARAC|nr:TMEM208 [Cordylochernes scorpioides]
MTSILGVFWVHLNFLHINASKNGNKFFVDNTSTIEKGKQGTKGQKQIYEENKSTIKFYMLMSLIAEGIYVALNVLLFWETFTTFYIMVIAFSSLVYFGCLQLMKSMAKPIFSESGALIDGGIDLNMEGGGFAETIKDCIILTAIVQSISILSDYCLLFWLLAPIQCARLLWINFLGPWFFQPAPPEVDEKKQRKMERRQKISYKMAR